MKKKVILFSIIICMILLFIVLKNNIKRECNAELSFVVLSDIHGNTKKFKSAIDDLYRINSNIDVLVLNGDSVDQGIDEQYDNIKSALYKSSKKLPNIIIKNMGNHEYYDYSCKKDTEENVTERLKRYMEFSGEEKIYHDSWIKGYHFISLGSDNNGIDKVNYTRGCISNEQIEWLKEIIGENYEEGRPIFVFLHQPIDMNFFGLNDTGVDKNDEIKDILLQYPEVILFTSHTHKTPNDVEDKANQLIEVNTGSVNSNCIADESSEEGFKEDKSYSNGVYVEVTDKNVTIRVRDFVDEEWIYTREIEF